MIFEKEMTARWHDTDATLTVRPSNLLVYMQETALYQLDTFGQNLDTLRAERGLAFILTRISLRFYRPIHAMETVRVATWVAPARGLNFPRCFRITGKDGIKAEAASAWALYDLAEHRPLRADEFSYAFEADEPLPFLPLRGFVRPACMEPVGNRRILYADLDYNGHMNNTRYPDMVCDYLPDGTASRMRAMDLYFAKEAKYGETLTVSRGTVADADGTAYLLQTHNGAGEVCLHAQVRVS